jgi:hypothetical protein
LPAALAYNSDFVTKKYKGEFKGERSATKMYKADAGRAASRENKKERVKDKRVYKKVLLLRAKQVNGR